MRQTITILFMVFICTFLKGQDVLRDTVELQIRDGLPNFFYKASTGQGVKIGYFGGSITDASGWRVKSLDWFRDYFNNSNIEGINACLGGTNSKYGVFRIEEHLLNLADFDLIFIEFAVNDLTNRSSEIEKCIEGIVRKIWKKNTRTDICFVHALREGEMLDTISQGKMPLTSTKHDHVAEYYGIPSVFFGTGVVYSIEAGTSVFKGEITDFLNDRDKEGRYVFTEDGVHPTNYGHEFYTRIVSKCFRLMSGNNDPFEHSLAPDLDAANYQNAKMQSYNSNYNFGMTEVTSRDEYEFLDEFLTEDNYFLLSEDPESFYELTCYCDVFGLSIIRGPGTGNALVEIDDVLRTVNFFDPFSDYYRENTFFISMSNDTHHIKIYPGAPLTLQEKKSILQADHRSDIFLNPSHYSHNYIIFNKILINGSITGIASGTAEREAHELIYHVLEGYLSLSVPDANGGWISIYDTMGILIYNDNISGTAVRIPIKTGNEILIIKISSKNLQKSAYYKIAVPK